MGVKNKLNVFIVTTWRDQSLLQNLLRSLDWAKDAINEIVIISEVKLDLSLSKKIKVRVLLKKDIQNTVFDTRCPSYTSYEEQIIYKLFADIFFQDENDILVLDSDFIVVKPNLIEELYHDKKPIWYYRRTNNKNPQELSWIKNTELFAKNRGLRNIEFKFCFMDAPLYIFKPLILKHLRRSLNIKGKFPDDINEIRFSEFTLYGAFINNWYINEYTMVRINYKDSTSGKLAATLFNQGESLLNLRDNRSAYMLINTAIIAYWSHWEYSYQDGLISLNRLIDGKKNNLLMPEQHSTIYLNNLPKDISFLSTRVNNVQNIGLGYSDGWLYKTVRIKCGIRRFWLVLEYKSTDHKSISEYCLGKKTWSVRHKQRRYILIALSNTIFLGDKTTTSFGVEQGTHRKLHLKVDNAWICMNKIQIIYLGLKLIIEHLKSNLLNL